MSISGLLILVALMGAIGGVVNALTSDNGFVLPKREETAGVNVLRPGFIGNIFLGAVASVVFWGLYGPFAEVTIVGEDPRSDPAVVGATAENDDGKYGETLAGLIGALVIGAGGARVITAEVDKRLLRATAAEASGKSPDPSAAAAIGVASPAEALKAASAIPDSV